MTEPFQIPWAPDIAIETASNGYRITQVYLHYGAVQAKIQVLDGSVFVYNHWEQKLPIHMRKDEALTRNLMEYLAECRAPSRQSMIVGWILNKPHRRCVSGVKEWMPSSWEPIKPAWELNYLKYGTNLELAVLGIRPNNVSRNFRYAHFLTVPFERGLIMSDEHFEFLGVWFGDVEGFLKDINEFSDKDPDTPIKANLYFKNGFLWVLDYLGFFRKPTIDRLPAWARKAINEDPDLLWPDLVARLKNQDLIDGLDPWLKGAVTAWILKHGEPAP